MRLAEFEDYLLRQGRDKTTIQKHVQNLRRIDTLTGWDFESLDSTILGFVKSGLKPATINRYIDAIRLYSNFAELDPKIQELKYLPIKNQTVRATFTDEEIMQIIELPCPKNFDKVQWKLTSYFFECLAFSGCRPGEIAHLEYPNDFDLPRNVVIIRKTKTGVPRLVPLPTQIIARASTMTVEKLYPQNDLCIGNGEFMGKPKGSLYKNSAYIFMTSRKKVFSDRVWDRNLKIRLEILGINRPNISAYSFRHSYATKMLEANVNVHKLAKILGHHITQTVKYEHLTTKDIVKASHSLPLNAKNLTSEQAMDSVFELISELSNRFSGVIEISYSRDEKHIVLEVKKPASHAS